MTIPDGYVETGFEDATHREFNGKAVDISYYGLAFVQHLVSQGATLLKVKPEPQVFEGTVRPDELGRWVRVPADMDAGSPVTVLPGKPEEWVCVRKEDIQGDTEHQGARLIVVRRAG